MRRLHHRPEFALYDLERDPHELRNLAEDADHAEIFSSLQTELSHWLAKWEDSDPIATEVALTTNRSPKGAKAKGQKRKTEGNQ